MVSLVRLMLFTTTVEILTVRTGSVQSCHQTPIFPYRGRARQTIGSADRNIEIPSYFLIAQVHSNPLINDSPPDVSTISTSLARFSRHGARNLNEARGRGHVSRNGTTIFQRNCNRLYCVTYSNEANKRKAFKIF